MEDNHLHVVQEAWNQGNRRRREGEGRWRREGEGKWKREGEGRWRVGAERRGMVGMKCLCSGEGNLVWQ